MQSKFAQCEIAFYVFFLKNINFKESSLKMINIFSFIYYLKKLLAKFDYFA